MSNTNVYFITIGHDMVSGSLWNYVICEEDLKLVESGLRRDEFHEFELETRHIVAENITEKQLEKFNDVDSWTILDDLMSSEYNVWRLHHNGANHKLKWSMEEKEELWADVHKELEEAKFNPRNPLGKLDFYRRAEEDGIEYKKIDPIELNFEKCHMCENCGKNMTERNTKYIEEDEEEIVVCVDCY